MKSFKLIIALMIVTSFVSCGDKRTPQLQYMPDMYVSVPYDANGVNSAGNVIVNRLPVAGTVSRKGIVAYDIPNTNEGYEKAKLELKNPLVLKITEAWATSDSDYKSIQTIRSKNNGKWISNTNNEKRKRYFISY